MARLTRLIDAYQAQNIFIEFFHIRKPQQLAAQRQAFALVPTADAIPVSFIQELIERDKQLIKEYGGKPDFEVIVDGLVERAVNYEALIEKWREKNGTETN